MRVLHIGKFYPPFRGGMEEFLAQLIHEQRQRGIEAHALVHGQPEPDDPPWVVRVPVQFSLSFAPIALGFRRALDQAIERIQPDVLHLHMPNNSALWALTLPAARRMPWLVHWHADVVLSNIKWTVALGYLLYRPFEQAVLERAQQVFVTSPPYLKASQALRYWHDKCAVVPLGIAATAHLGSPAPADLPWHPDSQLRLLSIGRLTYYKGFETLIEAVAQLPGVELLIAGEGELREELQQSIARHTRPGQRSATRLLGNVDEPLKHALLASCDLFCMASRERTEAFGVVLLEAMQHARACLVTDLPGSGMPWVVAQARCGQHVPLDDVGAWRSAIARLQHDAPLRQRLGQSGQRALQQFFAIGPRERAIARHYRGLAPQAFAHPGSRVRCDLLVVIATQDNAAEIVDLVTQARALTQAPVLVVDNRSRDATVALARQAGARVLTPLLAMSQWGSLQTGIRYALARGHERVLTLDALARYEAQELPALLAASAQADLVVGHFGLAQASLARRAGWQWLRWLSGLGLQDFASGMRVYQRSAMQAATSAQAGLLDHQDIGSLLLMRRHGLRIREVPLTLHSARVDRSGIFRSWAKALRYMATSSLVGMAHRQRSPASEKDA